MNLATQPLREVVAAINQIKYGQMPQLVTELDYSARAVLLAQMFIDKPRQMLVVEPIASKIGALAEDLQQLLPNVPVMLFPMEDALAIEFSFASSDQMQQRIEVLNLLRSQQPCIIVTGVAGLRKRLSTPDVWENGHFNVSIGDEWSRELLERTLLSLGYEKVASVERIGQYSIRGGIVDLFPVGMEHPIRLDFFDEEIDSMRLFDEESQQSIENIEAVIIGPAHDILFDVEMQQTLLPQLQQRLDQQLLLVENENLHDTMSIGMNHQLTLLAQGEPLKYASAYMEAAQGTEPITLLNYLNRDALVVISEYDKVQLQFQHLMEEDQFWIEQEVAKGQLLPGLMIKAPVLEVLKHYQGAQLYFSAMSRGLGHLHFSKTHDIHYRAITPFYNQMSMVKTEIDHWLKLDYVIQVAVSSDKQAIKLVHLFEEVGIKALVVHNESSQLGIVNVIVSDLSSGFELPHLKWVVVTEKELFNKQKRRGGTRSHHVSNAERIKHYNELNIGDYVVHTHHGIGQFKGLDTVEINGINKDFLSVVYQGDSRILIPVDQIGLLQKYVSSDSKVPKLNKLGGTEWAKTKRKVAAKIEDIADELIALYAKREQLVGHAFGPDTPEQLEFENAFSYIETDDQLRSAQEIKQDMEKAKPMDRLLVGDVGYGKTEVAMRAIFKAVMGGKQVAFLVPTTILAQQHYQSIIQRFSDYPIEVRLLSRFVTKKKQDETIEDIGKGKVDIVIGTHRLLSQDVQFTDLGLLVVDEEQRFGVRHKERLKQLKSQVDVLTLTATPIPRTLHMSMIGVRDLSLIETPPSNRFPVQTYVMERNEGAIKSAIEREMARGGQVFYLYNRVATIEQRALEIQALLPNARVAYAHGQMTETELETVLIEFIQGEYDVLVTTTIIETGVDIPNANTLFVEDADHMGLSTLYQLRGRVGRTNRVAYAYLMYEPFKQLSEVSEKRLQAIREFTELGSGFKIAMRDLSIRGAGNLLGKQQSGFIDSVGFDMYSQMLKEAVDVKRGIRKAQPESQAQIEWQLMIDAYIPSSYIGSEQQKIAIYKRIQQIDSVESYRSLQDQLIDRYGEYSDEVEHLLMISLIRYYGIQAGVQQIKQTPRQLTVVLDHQAAQCLRGAVLFEALDGITLKSQVQVMATGMMIQFNIQGIMPANWLSALQRFVQQVAKIREQEEMK